MKNNSFRKLTEQEKRAMLLGAIVKRTQGRLPGMFLENVVVRDIDVSKQYTIKVFEDAKEFATAITLPNHIMNHSWAGKKEHTAEGIDLLGTDGELVFGENMSYEYLNNGNLEDEEKHQTLPEFRVNSVACVSVCERDFSNYNNDNWDRTYNYIYIYLPRNKPFKVSERIQYVLDNFDI